jgi:hypothetical protein
MPANIGFTSVFMVIPGGISLFAALAGNAKPMSKTVHIVSAITA